MTHIKYTVKRGKAAGTVLTPHRYADGSFVVSKTRFEKDHLHVAKEEDIPEYLALGFKLRMSKDGGVPSLVKPC